jgi:hypothetical protein
MQLGELFRRIREVEAWATNKDSAGRTRAPAKQGALPASLTQKLFWNVSTLSIRAFLWQANSAERLIG